MTTLKWWPLYVADWQTAQLVRFGSPEARGLYMDLLCIMYQSPDVGYLANQDGEDGVHYWLEAEVVAFLRRQGAEYPEAVLAELVRHVAMKRDEKGRYYNERARRQGREQVRRHQIDAERAKKAAAARWGGGG